MGRSCSPLSILLVLSVLGAASSSRADEASGTWTGRVELRGSYYWERSTRVIAPTIGARVDSPRGVSMQGYYLVDSITSASVAAGALVDVGFQEVRHEGTFTVGGEVDVGEAQLALGGSGRVSREPDYTSGGGTVSARLFLDERTTTLGLTATYFHDEVRQVFRTGSQIRPPTIGTFDQDFDGVVLSAMLEHVVDERLLLAGGYDFGLLDGYLSSPYRQVQVDGVLVPEAHPDRRYRHTLWVRGQLAIPESRSALHALVRGYADDWDIQAITLETRWYQSLGPFLLLRVRHRYYAQTAAFFESGLSTPSYSGAPTYFTADPKMQRFHANEIGGALVTRLGFLDDSAFAWLRDAEIELACDYRFNTNRFGNAVFAAMVLRVPID